MSSSLDYSRLFTPREPLAFVNPATGRRVTLLPGQRLWCCSPTYERTRDGRAVIARTDAKRPDGWPFALADCERYFVNL